MFFFESHGSALSQKKKNFSFATPAARHHACGRQVLEAGLPAMVEKPLATTSEDAADLVKLNEEELPIVADLLELPDNNASAEALREKYNLEAIILTRGKPGTTDYTARGGIHTGCAVDSRDQPGASAPEFHKLPPRQDTISRRAEPPCRRG